MKTGWKTEPLGELCEFQRGLTYAKSDEVETSNNVVLRATNINLETNLLDFAELKYISNKVSVPDNKKVKKDSLMICTASGSKSHLGKVAYIDDDYDYAFGGFMGMITPKNGLNPKYLFHLMTSPAYKDFIGELSDGANINNLKFDDLKKFPIPHPNPSEQRRIVGLLDEAFVGIATAKANAEKNLQNVRALFASYLQSVFTQRGKGWTDSTLEDVLAVLRNGCNCKQDKSGNGVKISRIESIWNAQFDVTRVGYAELSDDLKNKFMLQKGDVLFSHINSAIHVGKTALFDLDEEVVHGVNLLLMRTKPMVRPAYLDLYLKHIFAAGYWLRVCKQSINQASVNQQDVNRVPFHYPDLKLQHEIVEQLDSLREETERLEKIYERKLAALEELKKSLLHQAFKGELSKS